MTDMGCVEDGKPRGPGLYGRLCMESGKLRRTVESLTKEKKGLEEKNEALRQENEDLKKKLRAALGKMEFVTKEVSAPARIELPMEVRTAKFPIIG